VICAIVLAAVGGFAAQPALADDPPAPSTTVPTDTEPTPDPAPPPKPAPKPKPKPAPSRPAAPAPYQPRPAPTVQTVTPRPVVHVQRSRPAKHRVRAHTKPKKPRHKVVHAKRKAAPPQIKVSQVLGAVGVRGTLQVNSDGSIDVGSLLIVWALALAIACFAVAAVPPRLVRWRPAAIFVADRQVDLMLVGIALLMASALTFLSTKGL